MNIQRTLAVAIAMAMISVQPSFAGVWQYTQDFETPTPPSEWSIAGIAGYDFNRGLAHNGVGNAWVRASQGWNAVNVWRRPPGTNLDCTAQAWIRLSPTVTDGYFSIRGGDGTSISPVINEIKLIGPWTALENVAYQMYSFNFNTGNFPQLLLYIGLWGNGQDAWEQIDDVGISCQTPF